MRIGVDLGGTKIEAIAIEDDGTTLLRRRVPTPVGDYPATLVAICDLVRDLAVARRVSWTGFPRIAIAEDRAAQKRQQHCVKWQGS